MCRHQRSPARSSLSDAGHNDTAVAPQSVFLFVFFSFCPCLLCTTHEYYYSKTEKRIMWKCGREENPKTKRGRETTAHTDLVQIFENSVNVIFQRKSPRIYRKPGAKRAPSTRDYLVYSGRNRAIEQLAEGFRINRNPVETAGSSEFYLTRAIRSPIKLYKHI